MQSACCVVARKCLSVALLCGSMDVCVSWHACVGGSSFDDAGTGWVMVKPWLCKDRAVVALTHLMCSKSSDTPATPRAWWIMIGSSNSQRRHSHRRFTAPVSRSHRWLQVFGRHCANSPVEWHCCRDGQVQGHEGGSCLGATSNRLRASAMQFPSSQELGKCIRN